MNKTRPPVHWTERIRVILFLVVYIAWVESTFPREEIIWAAALTPQEDTKQ